MGAATSIFYASKNPKGLEVLILDSPFGDLKKVAAHLANQHSKYIPNIFIKGALALIRKTIKKKADFDISKIKPIKLVSKIIVPAYIAYSFEDELIPYEQFENILHDYRGPKEYEIVEGGHNAVRQLSFYQNIGLFLFKHLKANELNYSPVNIPPHLVTDEILAKMMDFDHEELLRRKNQEGYNTMSRAAVQCYQAISKK